MSNPSRLEKIQIIGNANSATATKVNVQEANGEVNTQSINTAFNKNFGLNSGDVVGATTLLNQYSATPSDWVAQTYTLGSVVFYSGKQWLSKSATVAGDVPGVSSKWEEMTFESLANKTITVDAIPTDGSDNAVSSNGVFDALATKAPISSVHNPVTLGTANGLSMATQQLSLGLASSGVTGALSGTDWTTFNGKFNTPAGLTTNFLPKWNGSGFGNSQVFDNGTNIGIGTNAPVSKLDVRGIFSAEGLDNYNAGRTHAWSSYVAADGRLSFFKGGVGDALSISPSGNTLFGTTTDNGADKLQVNGSGSFNDKITAKETVISNTVGGVARLSFYGTQAYAKNYQFENGISGVSNTGFSLKNITDNRVEWHVDANGINVFNSSITASPAVSPNQVPILSQVATLTGNQTIAGIKTFSSPVIIPNGVNPNEGVNKGQLDAVVGTSGTFTVAGIQNATYMLVGKILTIYLSASFTGVSGGFIQGSSFTLPNGYISADFLAGRFVGNGSCFNGTSTPLTAWAEEMSNTSLRYNISGTGAVNHKSFITISLRIQ